MVTICTIRFYIQQFYTLPSHCSYVFVWISEQTAIISLYSINWLVFITEKKCVHCAVRTGYLNITEVNLSHLGCTMGSSCYSPVSLRRGPVRSQASPREICGGQSSSATDFSPNTGTSVFPRLYHYTNTQFPFSPTNCSYQGIARNLGTFYKAILFPQSWSIG